MQCVCLARFRENWVENKAACALAQDITMRSPPVDRREYRDELQWRRGKQGRCSFIRVVELPDKGKGVVASQDIPEGTLLVQERGLISFLYSGVYEKDVASIRRAYAVVDDRGKHILNELADVHLYRGCRTIEGIVFTNSCEVPCGKSCSMFQKMKRECCSSDVYQHFSRFNHACDPNVGWKIEKTSPHRLIMRTVRHVTCGEELCIDYGYEKWPFRCLCVGCSQVDDERWYASHRRVTSSLGGEQVLKSASLESACRVRLRCDDDRRGDAAAMDAAAAHGSGGVARMENTDDQAAVEEFGAIMAHMEAFRTKRWISLGRA